jgi:hypothetical protein
VAVRQGPPADGAGPGAGARLRPADELVAEFCDDGHSGARLDRPGLDALRDAAETGLIDVVLHQPRFVEEALATVYAKLLDDGVYLCSEATMYRVLREHGEVRERRARAAHPATVKSELVAHAPNTVWSWDIERHEAPRTEWG